MASERIEEYLEAIYRKQSTETPVSTSSIAEELKVSLPAVTDMLLKLEKRGLIEYTANKGAVLTEQGRKLATSTVRKHRLWERFLTDILGLQWDVVDNEACRLEHATSPVTEKALLSVLGDIDTCPHGHGIPDKNGNVKEEKAMPLWEISPGHKACIISVNDETPETLRQLQKSGLKPRTVVSIESKNSDNTISLKLADHLISLHKELASNLLARSLTAKELTEIPEEISMSHLSAGESGIVKSVGGGRGVLGRCLSLGFTPGSVVKMVENFGKGPVLVKIQDTEVALGRGVADRMTVVRSNIKY